MGYTHYFPHHHTADKVWRKIKADCEKVISNLPEDIKIVDESSDHNVWFNGFEDEGHETFVLYRAGSDGFEFCKTARKPYDLAVTACLLVYKHHSPDTIKVSSDGDAEDWVEAKALTMKLFNY